MPRLTGRLCEITIDLPPLLFNCSAKSQAKCVRHHCSDWSKLVNQLLSGHRMKGITTFYCNNC